MRQGPQASQQRWRRPGRPEFLEPGAGFRQGVERQVDAIKSHVIVMTILDVIVDLQGCAQRIVCWPRRIGLAVNIEHKTSDRHRGISAVFHQLVPRAVAQLGNIHAKSGEQLLSMARRQSPFFQYGSQSLRNFLALDTAEKAGLKRIEMSEFFARLESWMVGDVV